MNGKRMGRCERCGRPIAAGRVCAACERELRELGWPVPGKVSVFLPATIATALTLGLLAVLGCTGIISVEATVVGLGCVCVEALGVCAMEVPT